MLGRVIDDSDERREFNLLNAGEVRTLPDSQAFFITGNKKPVLLDVLPYYENRKFKNKHKLGVAHIPVNSFAQRDLESVFDSL